MKSILYTMGLLTLAAFASSCALAEETALTNGQEIQIEGISWKAQTPNSDVSAIRLSDGKATLEVKKSADMWEKRLDAPMLITPTIKGNFALEACVALDGQSSSAVAGVTVFNGAPAGVPRFTYGLDQWYQDHKVKFQGLPPSGNKPAFETPCQGVNKVWLRLECYRKELTNRPADLYVAQYKTQECAVWQEVARYSESVPNAFCGLFVKTSGPRSAEFSQMQLLPLESNKYVIAPPKVFNAEEIGKMLSGKKILFIVRPQYKVDHHNTATMFQTGEINTGSFRGNSSMKVIDFSKGGEIQTLLDCPEGIIRDPEISYDGTKVLFSMRKDINDDYHIYEMNLADKSVRQITTGSGLSDIDPAYLPDGKIVFSSTREPKYCMCNRHIMCNLYRMNADGSDIIQIGHSTLFEGHSSILADGRIVYDRWEYVDRNFGDAQGLWVTNPDGTNHALYYGNNTGAPGGFLEAREISGTTRAVCTLGSCHDRPWGAIAILDRSKGIEGKDGVLKTWPEEAFDLININGSYDAMKAIKLKFEDPYPLNEKQILCTRQAEGRGEITELCLINVDADEVIPFYSQPLGDARGCFDPMPIESRPLPRVITDRIDLKQKTGTFYVADVYIGTGMEAIPRGTAKWLRVVESPEKRFWSNRDWQGSGTQAPGMAWDDFNNKCILGTVPIEDDGSANFELPSDTFVYFQLLDEKGQMIQSMRSGTIVRPGENQGCIGCHEDRLNAVAPRRTAKAMLRPASKLQPWYGAPRNFSYTAEVQPVFDRNCIQCHDKDKPGAKKICLAGDINLSFNNSYYELRKNNKYVNVIGAGPAPVRNPRTWGSSVSPLAKVVLEGHGDPERDAKLHLTQEDKDRIITWLDINAPYYSEYSTVYPNNPFGRSPLTGAQLAELSALTKINLGHQNNANRVWFTRPELSSCLDGMDKNSDAYKKALAIIQEGKKTLEASGRPDTPLCTLDEREQAKQDKYDLRLKEERQRVQAAAEKQD